EVSTSQDHYDHEGTVERFTLGVTAILSMAVLSLVVTEKVPHSSEEVPLLIVYFHFNIVMVTLATTLTSTVMRVHSKGFSHRMLPPPQWLLRYLFIQGADFTSIPNGNSINVKRLVIAEQWGALDTVTGVEIYCLCHHKNSALKTPGALLE
ncbi:hypothetical protein ANCDUO_18880, partial [Ancylostoma duodenale]